MKKTRFSLFKIIRLHWIMWFSLVMLHLITSFHRVSFNVVADLLTAEFSLTGAGLGNLAAAYTYMYLVMQIPGGILVDRLGPRLIALITGLSMASGSILIGFAPSAALVFTGRLLIGLGGSVVLINVFKFQAGWFKENQFATLSGLALLISTSGSLLASAPLVSLVEVIGWRSSFIIMGMLTVGVVGFAFSIVRNKAELDPDSSLKVNGLSPVSLSMPLGQALKSILKNRRLWMPFLINTGTYGGFMVFAGTWGISYLVHVYEIQVAQASLFMIIAYLGYMVGCPAVGFLSDRYQTRRLPAIILTSLSCLVWFILIVWPGGPVPLVLFYFLSPLLGFTTAVNILSFPMARSVSPPGFTGIVTSVVNIGVFLGMAVLQPLFGYFLDLGWQGMLVEGARVYPLSAYQLGFLSCLVFALVALAASVRFREKPVQKS